MAHAPISGNMYKVMDSNGVFNEEDYVTSDLAHIKARDCSTKSNMHFTVAFLKKENKQYNIHRYLAVYFNGMKIEESTKGIE